MIQKGGVSNAGDRNQLRYKIEYMHMRPSNTYFRNAPEKTLCRQNYLQCSSNNEDSTFLATDTK